MPDGFGSVMILAPTLLSPHVTEATADRLSAPGRNSMVPGMLDVKGTQILAKSLFKELRGSGYTPNQILSLSTELIDLVTQDLKAGHDAPHAAAMAEESGAWRAAL
jgi:hypothetical protein